jgi:hypothetical protein
MEELETAGIEPNYMNVAIYVEFVTEEKLIDELKLNEAD